MKRYDVIVVGLGPAGLCALIKFHFAGLNAIGVDPRLGCYLRPGHLSLSVFRSVEQILGFSIWPYESHGHIKDLERALYTAAQHRGIKMEKKRFLHMLIDEENPGIVVADTEGQEETLLTDYVFDCTGLHRHVITAVNQHVPESPFQLETIIEVPLEHHLLAYVRIPDKVHRLKFNEMRYQFTRGLDELNASFYVDSIQRFRSFGWREFQFPRCYGAHFGKVNDKMCMYMHTPGQLNEKQREEWIHLVFTTYVPSIEYELLKSETKPHLTAFTIKAESLKKSTFKGPSLPRVTGLGDAETSCDYVLAHGIKNGVERMNALFEAFIIDNGKIIQFDEDRYHTIYEEHIANHQREMKEEIMNVSMQLCDSMEIAWMHFTDIYKVSEIEKREQLSIFMDEIKGRRDYYEACNLFYEVHSSEGILILDDSNSPEELFILFKIHDILLSTLSSLPKTCDAERKHVIAITICMIQSWQKKGDVFVKLSDYDSASSAYKKGVVLCEDIKKHGDLNETLQQRLVSVQSDLEEQLDKNEKKLSVLHSNGFFSLPLSKTTTFSQDLASCYPL